MKSLYIHIPFCLRKCLFCSFAISVAAEHRIEEYMHALEIEIKNLKSEKINTIYFGGGTPTMLNSNQIAKIMNVVRHHFVIDENVQWSIEANPDNVDLHFAKQLYDLGFSRMSLGIQTFNDTYLKFLGRVHDSQCALKAFALLREAGFHNINVDLMYGFPKQTLAELTDDLEKVAALNAEHVSIYTLTIEPNSRFHAQAVKLDSDEKLADDYVMVTEFLESRGLKQYEVSNFARVGFESRHNMVYWQGGDYYGVGMGAHSLIEDRRYWNEDTLSKYIEAINTKGHAIAGDEILSKQIRLTELLIFGLRMNQGVSVKTIEEKMGVSISQEQQDTLQDLVYTKFLEKNQDQLRTTLQGRLVLDEIAVRLI